MPGCLTETVAPHSPGPPCCFRTILHSAEWGCGDVAAVRPPPPPALVPGSACPGRVRRGREHAHRAHDPDGGRLPRAAKDRFPPGHRSVWYKEFAESYEWMHGQMNARLPTTGEGIVWLWARISRRHLSESCRLGRDDVLLTVEIPRARVLLSDFEEWHTVLNKSLAARELLGLG